MKKGVSLITVLIIIVVFGTMFLYLIKAGGLNLVKKPEQFLESNNNIAPLSLSDQEKVSVVAKNLEIPWSIAFLPDRSMLVTERAGRVILVKRDGTKQTISEISSVKHFGEGGLMGLALHPNFSSNKLVYVYYTYQGTGNNTLNRVSRFTYSENSLSNEEIIVDAIPGAIYHNGGRIKFGPDGFLYITTGDANQPSQAQNTDSLAGKILRVTDLGQPAPGNPFNNLVYSYGHRNPQGIAWDGRGQLWETEHGPSGVWPNCCQDEINRIGIGKNYGWPDSKGNSVADGTTGPAKHSSREIWAPGGAAFIENSLFFTGLREETLYKYDVTSGNLTEYFKSEYGRLREVVLGPDRLLYITTSNRDGRGSPKQDDDKILVINPEKLK